MLCLLCNQQSVATVDAQMIIISDFSSVL